MTVYAFVQNDTIEAVGGLPRSARRLDTQEWVMGLASAPVGLQQACGWYEVVDATRPADDATTTYDRSVTWDGKTVAVTWTARPKTALELAADTANTNRATIQTQATDALAANRTFLGIASPTNAQTLAQVKALTRQNQGIIRLLLNELDGTN